MKTLGNIYNVDKFSLICWIFSFGWKELFWKLWINMLFSITVLVSQRHINRWLAGVCMRPESLGPACCLHHGVVVSSFLRWLNAALLSTFRLEMLLSFVVKSVSAAADLKKFRMYLQKNCTNPRRLLCSTSKSWPLANQSLSIWSNVKSQFANYESQKLSFISHEFVFLAADIELIFWRLENANFRCCKFSSSVLLNTSISSGHTTEKPSIQSLKIEFMSGLYGAGAFLSPTDISENLKWPYLVFKTVVLTFLGMYEYGRTESFNQVEKRTESVRICRICCRYEELAHHCCLLGDLEYYNLSTRAADLFVSRSMMRTKSL